jgi:hypothetical protein
MYDHEEFKVSGLPAVVFDQISEIINDFCDAIYAYFFIISKKFAKELNLS